MSNEPPETDRLTPRELGRARLEARGRRIRRLRRRVAAVAVSVFVAVWGVVTVQLVSGHDPALAKTATATTTASGASTSTAATTKAATKTTTTAATTTTTASSPTPVTTSQS